MNNRRPLKTRQLAIAQQLARWLAKQAITPNQISLFSLVFATLAAVCLALLPYTIGMGWWQLPILSAIFIQGRLLCNLLDGMVAIEEGKQTRSGELFNEIPDRFADGIILVAAGYALDLNAWGSALGWSVALLAVLTAYIRALGGSVGTPPAFHGPMAKPHRMALLTAACLLTAIENIYAQQHLALLVALVLMVLGCIVTLYRRIKAIYDYLENHHAQ